MKKKSVILICTLLMLLGIPIMNVIPNTMSASSNLVQGEKAVDFVFGIQGTTFQTFAYIITENGNLFHHSTEVGGVIVPITEQSTNNTMGNGGEPLNGIVKVSAVSQSAYPHNVMALREDGTIYEWGDNSKGQFGNGVNGGLESIPVLVTPNVPGTVVGVQTTYSANFVLTDNGDVYASGDGTHGLLGNGTTNSTNTFTKVNISNVKKLAGEKNTMYALTNDGKVYSWGSEVYDGAEWKYDVLEPILINKPDGTPFTKVVDISCEGVAAGWPHGGAPGVSILVDENDKVSGYQVGLISQHGGVGNQLVFSKSVTASSEVKNITGSYADSDVLGFVMDGDFYTKTENPFSTPAATKVVKAVKVDHMSRVLSETGEFYIDGVVDELDLGIDLQATKSNSQGYASEEKYNDYVDITVSNASGKPITCALEDPVGSTSQGCADFNNNSVRVNVGNDRVYQKYLFDFTIGNREIIIDLYKGTPQFQNYSSTSVNKIMVNTSLSLSVPVDQTAWNSYTATITNSSGQTSAFTGGTLAKGTYTIHVTDAYGNTQDYQFEVSDLPEPTAIFTPVSTSLKYKDDNTKRNGTVGTFSLQYPAGEPTSTIASIQLGTGGDESHFSIDTTGALTVKGNDLDAGTYNVTVSGKDGNQVDFTKTVQIVVEKADQDNYQITNNANYPLKVNQEILITTTGNESGGNENYSITNGNTVAQISNGNKFKILTSGTFTLEATVQGNNNYNSKTVTKQITISQLPVQTNPIKISSGDSFIYGNTYTPTSTGGTGSGNVTWTIENDSGTGAILNNGSIKVTGVGTFTLKVTKAGDTNYQSSSDSKVITVNKRNTTVKPKDVTRKVGETFKDNGVTYNPQPIAGDSLGTPIITSKYPLTQPAGRYTDGIQVTGLTNPNYDFEYQEGTLVINDTTLPNNGSGYYKITGTLGKNNWYISDIQISTINKDGYDEISSDGINFQTTPLIYQTDGEYPITFYLKNSTTGIIAKGINYQVKIDQTPPTVPTLTMNQLNTSRMARLINFLSFGNWMNTGAEVIMSSTDGTSGIDNYTYIETDTKGSSNTKTSTTGKVTYQDDVEIGITAKACDKAGNCSDLSASETLMIDRKGPDITGVKDQSVYKYYYLPRFVKVKDNGSGLSYAEYLKDGAQAGTIQEDVDERIDGVGKYEVNAIDNAGNESTLSFEIVPLPDIEDIDGSDESKDIIDQVKDEYEEVKDHLTDEERKEYEDWIKDAEDKWESERKQVIETDDKSSKVEGQDGTTFDPNLELIVDDITNTPIPPLPKNANVVYDVYLQKGNTKVQPDGSIKVYLPYTDSEDPIIYQIDENGKVTEIKAEKEGNYVTFITDELGKFAISNTAQPDNKDNMCVVGPDGKVESGDEVCGKPNDKGDQPTKKPDGSVEVPDGGKVEFPNGTEIETPDGAIINPDGSVTLPDGTEYDPNGNIKDKDVCKLDGKEINIDTDGDGIPDINLDLDGDCTPDINIDNNGDQVPDINIDTTGDGKPNINLDTNGDGKADLNVLLNIKWKPNATFTVHGFTYNTMTGLKPQLNIDDDGDGKPDRNIDANGNGIIDSEENKNMGGATGGANTGDSHKWIWWLILLMITSITMIITTKKNRKIHFNK